MLRYEACAEQFDTEFGQLANHRFGVKEPPAAKQGDIPEFAGKHGQLMLVLPGKHRNKQLKIRVPLGDTFKQAQVRMHAHKPAAAADLLDGAHRS